MSYVTLYNCCTHTHTCDLSITLSNPGAGSFGVIAKFSRFLKGLTLIAQPLKKITNSFKRVVLQLVLLDVNVHCMNDIAVFVVILL